MPIGSSLDRAVIEIDADVDGDGSDETGVFHMVGDLEIQQIVRPDPILGPELQNIQSAIRRILNDGEANRKGAYVDIGAGRHAFEFNFLGWEGAQDSDGNPVQWGNTGTGGTVGDATGEDPLVQMQVFHRYLQVAVVDSFNPARLYVGEYTDGTYGTEGRYSQYTPMKVMLETQRGVRDAMNPNSYDGSITAVEVLNLEGMVDVARRLPV
jgi:hypothetical protein